MENNNDTINTNHKKYYLDKNLTFYQKKFFINMENYLDEKLYFYGSVIRDDYFAGKSDIDVCVFTNNVQDLKLKIQTFLKVDEIKKFKKVFWRLKDTNRLAKGYKIFYKNENITTEIAFYDIPFRDEILKDHYSKTYIPFYASVLLFLIKVLFYDLNILSQKQYAKLKKMIFANFVAKENDDFVVI